MTAPVRLRPVLLPRVDFDAAAMRLLTEVPGGEHLDLTFGPGPARSGLSLHVSPTAPLGDVLMVFGGPDGVLEAHCRAVPCAVASVLYAIGEATGRRPRCGFSWPPHGLLQALAAVLLHRGDTAGQVRALLRRAEPDRRRRPVVHLID